MMTSPRLSARETYVWTSRTIRGRFFLPTRGERNLITHQPRESGLPRLIAFHDREQFRDTRDGNWVICMTVDLKKIIQPILFSRRSTVRRRNLLFFSHVIMLQLIDGNLWMCIHEKEEGTRDFFAFKTTDNVTKRDFWRGIESLN